MHRVLSKIIAMLWLVHCLGACGSKGDTSPLAEMIDVSGSITSRSGGQAELSGWRLASIERDSQITHTCEIDAAGMFSLKSLRRSKPQTLVLLSPDSLLRAVLSMPGTSDTTIKQYFKLSTTHFPRLIANGPIMIFSSYEGLEIAEDTAASETSPGMPNGAFGTLGYGLAAGSPATGSSAGIPMTLNPDINGNGVVDLFDTDVNGDGVTDSQQKVSKQFFSEGLEYVAPQLEMASQTDGTFINTLQLSAKLRVDAAAGATLSVIGAPSLLSGATVSDAAFDGSLVDNGLNEDGAPGDGLFGRRVSVTAKAAPRGYSVIFFRMIWGSAESPSAMMEFPFVFPQVTVTALAAPVYDALTRTIQRVGGPFGEVKDYFWSVVVADSAGRSVYNSIATAGTVDSLVLPASAFDATGSEKYTAKIVARTYDQVPGYSLYMISSPGVDLN